MGGPASSLGLPVGNGFDAGGGWQGQAFQNGGIGSDGVHAYAAGTAAWNAAQAAGLGVPTGDGFDAGGGWWGQAFQNGGIVTNNPQTAYVTSIDVAGDHAIYCFCNGQLSPMTFATGQAVLTNLLDSGVRAVAQAEFARDGALTRNDMLSIFSQVEQDGVVSGGEFFSLEMIVNCAATLNMSTPVSYLTSQVVNGDPANAHYQGQAVGNLSAGSPAWQLQDLVNKWFLGQDLPIAKGGDGTVYSYAAVSGHLYSLAGTAFGYTPVPGTAFNPYLGDPAPSYQDISQGKIGTCYFLAALGEVALDSPQSIQSMFTDNFDGTYTVRFFQQVGNQQVAQYVTVNRSLPVDSSNRLVFAGIGANASDPSNVLWVALAEKAYAQLAEEGWSRGPGAVNSYQSIASGDGKDPLQQILGQSTQHVVGSTSSGLLGSTDVNTLITDIQAGYLVTLGTQAKDGDDTHFFSGTNIAEQHEYYLKSYDSTTGLFTIVNPWGCNLTSNGQAEGTLQLTAGQLMSYFNEFDTNAQGSQGSQGILF
jgi:hypothetical protein